MNNKPHVTRDEFIAFKQESMTMEEQQTFLDHICSCNHCADQFTAIMAEEIIPAPRDMKENILQAVKRPEVQLAMKSKEASKRIQLLLYSLKVGTAAVAAIALLVLSVNFQSSFSNTERFANINYKEDHVSLTDNIRNNMNNISKNILDFSNNIIKMEVIDHDQKEE